MSHDTQFPSGESGGEDTAVDSREPDPLIGHIIADRLELTALLGEGACGKVYRAKHLLLDKTVAIKVLHKHTSDDPRIALRFKAEARAASRLDHPNSSSILDFGEDQGLLYIAMEFLDGENLDRLLDRDAPLDSMRVARIMVQVCAALTVAHREGIVHRDLKPGNIMLVSRKTEDGDLREIVKVCDFGLAKSILEPLEDASGAPLTLKNAVVGTPSYMSPEQASGGVIDARTDQYACGVLMFEMLTGILPFYGDSHANILMQQILTEPPQILSIAPGVNPVLAEIAHRAMQKKREDRFESARDMMIALRGVLGAAELDRIQLRVPSVSRGAPAPVVEVAVEPAVPAALEPAREDLDAGVADPIAEQVAEPSAEPSSELIREHIASAIEEPMARAEPPVTGELPTLPPLSPLAPAPREVSAEPSIDAGRPYGFGAVLLSSLALLASGVLVASLVSGRAAPPDEPAAEPKPAPDPAIAVAPSSVEVKVETPILEPVSGVSSLRSTIDRAPRVRTSRFARAPELVPQRSLVRTATETEAEAASSPAPAFEELPPLESIPAAEAEPAASAPSSAATPANIAINVEDIEVGGGLTRRRCAVFLDKPLRVFKACVGELGAAESFARGLVLDVRGRIDDSGRLRNVAASGAAAAVLRCAESGFERARMPHPDTGEAQIAFRIRAE